MLMKIKTDIRHIKKDADRYDYKNRELEGRGTEGKLEEEKGKGVQNGS